MRAFLTRRWFLLTLALGCGIAAAWPSALDWARWAPPRYVMPAALFLTAWMMPAGRLAAALRRPRPAILAVMMGFTLPPLLGWAFGHLLPPDFRIGLLVMCYGPCTLASAVIWTRLARGDEASAILATMLSSGVGWLVTPALLELTLGASIAVDYPAMMRDLALTLVLPVALGQAVRALPPFTQVARKYRIALDVLSRLLVLVVLFGAARGLAETMREPGRLDGPALLACVAACLAVHLVALAAAWLAAAGCRIERAGRIAVALAGSQKTLPVALVVLDLYFSGQPLAVVPLVLYHAGQLVADTLLAERWAGNLASPEDFARV